MEMGIKVTVRWMPSHLTAKDERPPDVSDEDIMGNEYADNEARKAANRNAVPLNVAAPVLYDSNLVKRIQKG